MLNNKKMKLIYITNEKDKALIAEKAGVHRILVDLESIGKKKRQTSRNTFISTHTINDLKVISDCLTKSELVVRINPINENSKQEIEEVLKYNPEIMMLPMFKTVEEIKIFIELVSGRAKNILLLERIEAVEIIDDILEIDGIDEFHIGLNDLSLSMGMNFMFETFSNGTIEYIVEKIHNKGYSVGIGGMSRIGKGDLPAELILAEHCRLGSNGVILSRGFMENLPNSDNIELEKMFIKNVENILSKKAEFDLLSKNDQKKKTSLFNQKVKEIIEIKSEILKQKKV